MDFWRLQTRTRIDPVLDELVQDLEDIEVIAATLERAKESGLTPGQLVEAYGQKYGLSLGKLADKTPPRFGENGEVERLARNAFLLCVAFILWMVFYG